MEIVVLGLTEEQAKAFEIVADALGTMDKAFDDNEKEFLCSKAGLGYVTDFEFHNASLMCDFLSGLAVL